MARARNIKPSFFMNERLAECEPLARLLFAGLWTLSDREGRLEDRPKKIKAELLPYDQCDSENLLQQLATYGFIMRYAVDGKQFIQVLNFVRHQNPHVKEPESTIPVPDLSGASPVTNLPLPPSPIPLTESPILIPPSNEPVKKPVVDDFILPEWIDSSLWDDFMEVRKKKQAANTPRAKNSIVRQLVKFRIAGHEPTDVIENSIRNSWKDVFEPKQQRGFANNQKPPSTAERDREARKGAKTI